MVSQQPAIKKIKLCFYRTAITASSACLGLAVLIIILATLSLFWDRDNYIGRMISEVSTYGLFDWPDQSDRTFDLLHSFYGVFWAGLFWLLSKLVLVIVIGLIIYWLSMIGRSLIDLIIKGRPNQLVNGLLLTFVIWTAAIFMIWLSVDSEYIFQYLIDSIEIMIAHLGLTAYVYSRINKYQYF